MTERQFRRNTRFAKIMTYQAFETLSKATEAKRSRLRYPIPINKYFTATRPARLLTKCVLEYIRVNGGHAEEIKTTGTLRKDKTGKMVWAYSQTMAGSADIHAVINGKFIAIEIKIGRDRQSEAQKIYQKKIQASGARYIIIKQFDDLLKEINIFDNNKKIQKLWD